MSVERTVPLFIRATHRDAYRSGQWAKVLSVELLPPQYGPNPRDPRPVYIVEFVDGKQDQWPVYDDVAGYEFHGAVTA